MPRPVCYLDTEVRSRVPIKHGAHAFLACPDARLLMVTWRDPTDRDFKEDPLGIDSSPPVHVWQPHLGAMPPELVYILGHSDVVKKAHNAQFDFHAFRYLLPRHGFYLGETLSLDDWECTMVQALGLSLPANLEDLGAVLGLPEDQRKLTDGKKLIRLFCMPQYDKTTDSYYWATDKTHPSEWARFVQYGLQDTVTLARVAQRMNRYAPPEREWELWRMDQRINMNGLPIDDVLVQGALKIADREKTRNLLRMRQLSGVANPNSVTQLQEWAENQLVFLPDMTKLSVLEAIEDESTPDDVREALQCRQEVAKTSTAKYTALVGSVSADGRLRGAFQFRGASRTGRYTGRIFQPHNLPRGSLKVDTKKGIDRLTPAVDLIRAGDPDDELSWMAGRPMDVLSSCIRSVVRAPSGYVLQVSDLNAIENRVLGYLARCEPTLQIFRDGLDPYKAFGSRMFRKAYEDVTPTERTESKPAVLGCFGADTLVLTGSGWKPIVSVAITDLVFDGTQFVPHDGVICQGVRETITMSGVVVTPEHEVLTEAGWRPALDVTENTHIMRSAVRLAGGPLSIPDDSMNRSSTIRSSAEVFDIVNAGPQHRFLILTTNGPMIVHNCGYQLGGGDERLNVKTGRMEKTGLWGYAAAMKIHLTKEQSHEAVKVFRDTFPAIVQLWYDLDDAFRSAIGSKLARRVGFMTLRWEKPFVTIELPSGRKLYYCSPEIQPRIPPWELDNEKPKSRPTITFKQIDQKSNSWVRTTTHGGKLTENVCQAVANDVLNEGLWRAEQGIGLPEPYEIIGHVHDEGIALVPWDSPLTVEHLSACLSHPVPWAPDLPLAAHGFTTQIYRKD